MNEAARRSKQLAVAVIFFLILGGISFGIYRGVKPSTPTPTPDPTINLAPISVVSKKIFNVENLDYDVLVQVRNSNSEYGSGVIDYEISFLNLTGSVIQKKTGSFYILPNQTKYLVDGPVRLSEVPNEYQFKILGVDWQKLNNLGLQGAQLLVRSANYVEIVRPGVFGKVGGEIFNSSDFDLNKVDVTTIPLDSSGEPIAVNKTEIRTFLARTTRGFETTWFSPFVGGVDRVHVESSTNVFENLNFLREYGGQERFKQLY